MNVLVYTGSEVRETSFNHTLSSLKSILFPHYAVQPLTKQALITEPWAATCALLVVPQCHTRFLPSPVSKPIQEYLEHGGAYLGLGTGALYSPPGLVTGFANLNLGISSGEDTRLRFYDKFNRSSIYPETSGGEGTPGLAQLRLPDEQALKRVFDAGIGEFVGFEDARGVVVLAHYADREGVAAGVAIDVGGSKIALWSPNIEYSLSKEPASSLLAPSTPPSEVGLLEVGRRKLLKATLVQLGLQITEKEGKSVERPLPQFLTSTPTKPHIVSTIIQALSPGSPLGDFKDANDTFQFVDLAHSSELLEETRANMFTPSDSSTWQPKHVVLCANGELPSRELTPLFDLDLFFRSLAVAREQKNLTTDSEETKSWGVGEALLYGEAITSTQTMLDKNPHLLTQLPTPLLSLASFQFTARGRGNNVWNSLDGGLQFSILLRAPQASLPANRIGFIQYLFTLAVVEACRKETVLGKWGERIRLKWPNDIYALVGDGEEKKKVGGVLVNVSFSGEKVDLVIGCGLNILPNPPSIASISDILPHGKKNTLSIENTAAAIMATFEPMWTAFVQNGGSFEPFIDLYLKRWLHSDQLVTLTTTTPPSMVRITGITLDHGLLRTVPERPKSAFGGPKFIDLQADGNSFDFMAGLIKSK